MHRRLLYVRLSIYVCRLCMYLSRVDYLCTYIQPALHVSLILPKTRSPLASHQAFVPPTLSSKHASPIPAPRPETPAHYHAASPSSPPLLPRSTNHELLWNHDMIASLSLGRSPVVTLPHMHAWHSLPVVFFYPSGSCEPHGFMYWPRI